MTNTKIIYQIQDLTESQKEIIKASVPVLEQSGELLTSKFYNYMLENYPEVKPFFNPSNQRTKRQPKILAFALLNYAKNIDNLAPLLGFVKQIVTKHVGLQVKPEHYPIVGNSLLHTMKVLLGDLATDEFLKAWEIAYGNLAQILINAEDEVYVQNKWDGFKEFEVTRIQKESLDVKSVYFTPADGGDIAVPKRGQYVTFRWKLPNDNVEQSREYSLSMFPSDNEYRISVRHLNGGVISSYIHSNVEVGTKLYVAPPAGQFFYREGSDEMLIFAGGIGITPLVSIVEQGLKDDRKVTLFFSNKKIESRPFSGWLSDLKKIYKDKFTLKEFFSQESEVEEGVARRLQSSDFEYVRPDTKYDVYLLGPPEYMRFVTEELSKIGIKKDEIASEFFGPVEV